MKRQHVRRGILLGSFALFQTFRLVHLMFSPVLLLLAAAHGVVGGSMLVYGAAFTSSLVLGRAFYGWVCPGCGLQLPVAQMVESGAMAHDECLLCGTCVDGCPSNAVRFAFSRVPAGATSG